MLTNPKLKEHFHTNLFHGFDFDRTMLRIGSMNMLLHGVEQPDIRYHDALTKQGGGPEEDAFSLLLANPPFAGSLDYENCVTELQRVVKTKKLLFTKTNSGGTDHVWFYDVDADGWSLDDKRTPLLPEDKLGPVPKDALTADEHLKNNLPDVLAQWKERNGSERERPRTAQSFCVPKADIVAQGYDLSLNRYKEVVHEEVAHDPPHKLLADLAQIEEEIQRGMAELKEMLK